MAPIPEKAMAALNAMKAIGIPMQTSKPVLKNLLKVYEHNWEYIEAENYRVLADAILDMQELKVKEDSQNKKTADDDTDGKGKNVVVSNDPEPIRTRLRPRKEDHHLSPSKAGSDLSGESSLKRPRLESDVLPEGHPEHKRDEIVTFSRKLRNKTVEPASPQPSFEDAATQNLSPQPFPRHRATGVMSPQGCESSENGGQAMNQRETRTRNQADVARPIQVQTSTLVTRRTDKQAVQEKISNSIPLKEPKVEPGSNFNFQQKHDRGNCSSDPIRPKDEPRDYDSPVFETPIAMIRPPQPLCTGNIASQVQASHHGSLRNSSTLQQNTNGSMAQDEQTKNTRESLPVDACKKVSTSEVLSVQESSPLNVDIASSDLGEVKLSFCCSSDRPDFHVPNLEAVLKRVEDRCLKSYRILQPDFSLMNLMKEMCQCFLELGSETTDDKQENVVQIITALDALKKPVMPGVYSATMPECSNNSMGSALTDLMTMDRFYPSCSQNDRGNNQNRRSKKMKEPELPEHEKITSCSMVVVQQPQHPLGELRPLHDVNDISKGEERVRISVINEITRDKYPPSFYYIPRNIVYQNAYVNFSLARIGDEDCCADCFGDCLAAPIPCACARETGGEFAYTSDGVIKKEFLDECISMYREPEKHHQFYCNDCPLERSKSEDSHEACKGHLVRKFIKECWSKCGCSMHCGNRVVQRGIMCNLQVFNTSEEKGWGVRTLDELPRGAFVCEYVGEVLTNMELYDRTIQTTGNAKHTYPVLLDADWGSEGALKDEEALCLDATFYGNVARFINHRCFDANLVEIPVEVETPDHHYYHLAFFTTRKVEAFEELTWDYGIDFDDHGHPIKAFRCKCGSRFCRDIKCRRTRSRALVR